MGTAGIRQRRGHTILIFHDVEQGSGPWLELRKGKATASVAAAVLGKGKFKPRNQRELWLFLKGQLKTDGYAPAMQHGNNVEPVARATAEGVLGTALPPIVVGDGIFLSSLDGLSVDGCVLEIKCPMSKTGENWRFVAQHERPPDHHYWQMVQQVGMVDAKRAVYFVYHADDDDYLMVDLDVEHMKEDWTETLKPAWEAFWPTLDRDTLPSFRDDAAFRHYEEVWLRHAQLVEYHERLRDIARGNLIELVGETEEADGECISMQKITRRGRIDYKSIPVLGTVDLEEYRSPDTSFWKITRR